MSSGTTPGHTEDPPDEDTDTTDGSVDEGDGAVDGDGELSPESPLADGGTAGAQTSPGAAGPGLVSSPVRWSC
ncbi:hypothetical protein K6U06_10830 [Acidiferrimicrobium sp. IK]|uniref:hypothetical protein n=1 Tax=Acidiferrimicrobium sp. IK TaxID=2871700 RepID=UPI0021CB61B1|nr:hypothetical protein [Acidiferrimicrobium sp. IK]MCU4184854.1 hypothetical protein [Acidiferrimicrobium sp. IK]